jgi:hypothetical protein
MGVKDSAHRYPAVVFRLITPTLLLATVTAGCQTVAYEPQRATRPYPRQLTQGSVAQVQVIPGAHSIRLVNATANGYANFDLWLNQRYVTHVDALPSGQTLEVPLDRFWDERGEPPFEGGWFRYYQPTPIVLVQAQMDDKSPLVGFVCTLPEVVRER